MANPEHLQILKQGVEAWNQWRDQKQDLDNLRRKDSLRGAETAQISVHLGNYSASHFEGSADVPRDCVGGGAPV
jgi:hypothetical protein